MGRNLFPRLQQTFVGRKIAWRAQRMSRRRLLRGALSAWSFQILSGAPLKEVMFCLYNNETPHRDQEIFLCIRMILEQRLTNAGTNLWHYIKGWWPWKKYWPSEKWYNFIKGRVSKRNSYHPLYAKFLLSPLFFPRPAGEKIFACTGLSEVFRKFPNIVRDHSKSRKR